MLKKLICAVQSYFRPHRKCCLFILCMTMERWTLSFYLGNAEIESYTYTSKAENAEENSKPRVLEKNILFSCNHIYFPKSTCECDCK